MAQENNVSEFSSFYDSLISEGAVAAVQEKQPEPQKTIAETVKLVPSTTTEVVETPKPAFERTYREVDGKVQIDSCGLRAETTIYPRGYAKVKFSRKGQDTFLYEADLDDMEAWFKDPNGYAKWKEEAKANGLK